MSHKKMRKISSEISDSLTRVNPNDVSTFRINNLPPELFQRIIDNLSLMENWRKIMPLRTVSLFWKTNIDAYLASRRGFQYVGRVVKGQPPPNINYRELNAMLSFYPNMRQLIIKNFMISDGIVWTLKRNCPKLERLSLSACKGLTWKGVTALSVRYGERLTFLDVSHCDFDENCLGIICENLKCLKTLNAISPGQSVTGTDSLVNLGPNIEDLWIGLSHLQDPCPALKALVSGNGRNLKHLGVVLNNVKPETLNLIAENITNLISLKLTFTSNGCGSLSPVSKLKNLEFVILAENSLNAKASLLTDDSISAVVRGCSKLKSLAIAGTKPNTCRFTDYSLSLIPRFRPLIEQIRLLNAHAVTDDSLYEFAKLCNLRVLHLQSMSKITDKGILAFLCAAKKIRNFRLSDCKHVTEAIIEPFIAMAKARPEEVIKVYLSGVTVERSLEGLPKNLKLDSQIQYNTQGAINSITNHQAHQPHDQPQHETN